MNCSHLFLLQLKADWIPKRFSVCRTPKVGSIMFHAHLRQDPWNFEETSSFKVQPTRFQCQKQQKRETQIGRKKHKKTILGLWHNFSAAALPILDRKSHGILRVLLKLPFWLCQKKGGGLKIYLICLLLKMTLSCRRHPSFWEFWISAYPKTPSFFRICCKDPPHLWLENLAKFPVFWNGMHCKLPVKPQDLVQHLPQVIGQKYQSISYPSKEYHTVCHLQPCNSYFSYEAMNV